MRTLPRLLAVAILGGCASTATTTRSEFSRLNDECQGRGGYLAPIPGVSTANIAAQYTCVFRQEPPPLRE